MPPSSNRKPKTEKRKPAAPEGLPGLPLVAIVGRANVGKSTLFNRLTRSAQALVADIAGVTRDRLYGTVTFDERQFMLVDTGGLVGGGEEEMEAMVRRQAEAGVAEADVILLVMDGKVGPQPGDNEVVEFLRRTAKPVLLAVNKIDHPGREEALPEFYRFGITPLYPISAAHGLGVVGLLEALVESLPPLREAPILEGIRVAVVGRPNVGKSSFINYFLGKERLLVSDLPGTTRDAVDTPLKWEEKDYVLIDTAGLRRPAHVAPGLERQMVLRAIKSLVRAQVAVLMLDAQEGLTQQDSRIAGLIEDQGRGCLILVNKWDLIPKDPQIRKDLLGHISAELEFMAYAPILPVSVKSGYNLKQVFPLIAEIHAQSCRRAGTRELNLLLQEITQKTPPPRFRDRPLKFYYLTQPEILPPTFIAFVNAPQGVPHHYRRYLVKQLRERLEIPYAPVRLFLKGRQRRQ
jgi:GTP-binding protein